MVTTTQPLDPAAAGRLTRLGGAPLLAKVYDAFLRDMPVRAQAAALALDARDALRLAGAVHPMVSSGWNVGAPWLAEQARAVEQLARRDAWDALPAALADLVTLLERALALVGEHRLEVSA